MIVRNRVPILIGRERELNVLDGLLDHIRDHGGALVLRGEPGIGKSSLLHAAHERAINHGILVLTAAGVQSESHLPFAGLHQLLHPIQSSVDGLPAPQRAAIEAAFGINDIAAPDIFLIALAALNMLSESATRSPVLLIAEDAQWLDRPTCDVLVLMARRLELESILILTAIRDDFESTLLEAGLDELQVNGLDQFSASSLLDAYAADLPVPCVSDCWMTPRAIHWLSWSCHCTVV